MIVQYKNKLELDSLVSYDDVYSYRIDVLKSDNPDWKRYVEELKIYMDERFVDRVLKQYKGYLKILSTNVSLTNAIDKTHHDAIALVAKSIQMSGGVKKYYNTMLTMQKNELGKSKYELYVI